ncbi:MAG TPA: zinc ribbon domain-containing protein [Actinomycetota bacterium]|nr:zinc ribbon domain-containing protein [Actinomycetota bacterium]
MPIYEFRCSACEKEFETLISSAKVDEATCPSCGAGRPRRLMSVIAGMGGRTSPNNVERASGNSGPAPSCGAGACPSCS